MKLIYKYYILLFVGIAMAGLFTSCSEDEGGKPMISYIRVTDPASSDSLLVAAGQGQLIAIIGQNLGDLRELWVNDQRASLTPTLITNTSVLVQIPEDLPKVITNVMTLIFSDGSILEHPFILTVSAPSIASMVSEYVPEGGVATIRGDYFYEPLTVTFTGGVKGTIESVEDDEIKVVVPAGALPGPITVTTNFGITKSTLHFRDNRVFLNYDNLTPSGSWRGGTWLSDGGIDGKYLLLKGKMNANDRAEDYAGGGFVSQFWGQGSGRPEGSLLPGKPIDYVLKFEVNVIEWYGSYLNICFGPWNNNGNQEYWGDLNARAYWGPWDVKDALYKSNGWMTAVIPMTDFAYKIDGTGGIHYVTRKFEPEITGSLTFALIGSPKAAASPVELHIDNVRIVPK